MEPVLRRALETFRIVVLSGPRQSGKTTLARQIAPAGAFLSLDGKLVTLDGKPVSIDRAFLSLDDPTLAALARDDPAGFVSDRTRPTVIDEVQRGGDDLVRAIKLAVDADPAPGRFLLTGSAGFLHVPVLSESLAGRAVFFELAPFSQVETEAAVTGCWRGCSMGRATPWVTCCGRRRRRSAAPSTPSGCAGAGIRK